MSMLGWLAKPWYLRNADSNTARVKKIYMFNLSKTLRILGSRTVPVCRRMLLLVTLRLHILQA